MKLTEMKLAEYIELLGSDAPAPGGGSAGALCGAQGAALAGMVAALTLGKKKYADWQELCERKKAEAEELQRLLTAQVDRDTEAFNMISAALALPKESEEEKAARRKALADATLVATQVPFETLELACRALEIPRELVGRSNKTAASDLGVSALQLLACVRASWLNVKINLSGIANEAAAADFDARGQALVERAEQLSEEIYREILAQL